MIGAPNTRNQKYWVGIVQCAPETSVLEEIADIFTNYNIDIIYIIPQYVTISRYQIYYTAVCTNQYISINQDLLHRSMNQSA